MNFGKLLGEWSDTFVSPALLESADSSLVAGVDEAGRGPLAGPVVAAALILPKGCSNKRIIDSKKLNSMARERVFAEIVESSLAYSIVFVGPEKIDQLNIREATRFAMGRAAEELHRALNNHGWRGSLRFLVDGNVKMATLLEQETIIKGDDKVRAISGASILAKVSRDHEMLKSEDYFPGYGFALHKGYPTVYHRQKVRELGPCAIHRRTFAGVKEFLVPE